MWAHDRNPSVAKECSESSWSAKPKLVAHRRAKLACQAEARRTSASEAGLPSRSSSHISERSWPAKPKLVAHQRAKLACQAEARRTSASEGWWEAAVRPP